MYALAVRRRLALLLKGDFDPYPAPPPAARLSPFEEHRAAYEDVPLALSWRNAGGDADDWQRRLRGKLGELSGYRRAAAVPTVLRRERAPAPGPGLRRERVYLRAWPAADIPIDLVWRDDLAGPAPVMLCLQGTNAGAHLSWGEARMPPDPLKIAHLDIARQAAAHGHVAVCIEQRAFGERRERALRPASADPCIDAALHSLLLGRTLLGDRAADVSAVIDWLEVASAELPAPKTANIRAIGHSSGGSVALYAAALDVRISALVASGCVGPLRETIAVRRDSSGQNVIPGQLLWYETEDVLGLVAPRPLLVVSGQNDHIFPYAGAAKAVAAAGVVYAAMDADRQLKALATPGGHRFDPAAVWPAFRALMGHA